MFSGLTIRLQSEIETVKNVLQTHERLRALLYGGADGTSVDTTSTGTELTSGTSPPSGAWSFLKERQPKKSDWQVYDHCAAFTRLYALYEQFVIELASEFLRILPNLYTTYHDLPNAIRTQHRLGAGQILLKLGKDGPYKKIDEAAVIKIFSHGFGGHQGYSLLEDAFFVDQQNYRSEIIVKIFSYLGFEDCWSWVKHHPAVVKHMESQRDEHETPEKTLSDFIERRNEAAHGSVNNIISVSDILSIADFIFAIATALAELVAKQVAKRQIDTGVLEPIGAVIHNFSGTVAGARMSPVMLSIGDSVVVVGKQTCYNTKIESIQNKDTPQTQIQLTPDQEIGLKLSRRTPKGSNLYRYRGP